MKKLFATTALAAAVLFNLPANAQENANMPQVSVMTIEQVQTLADDTPVVLEGMIIQSLGNEKYTFKDASGATITVEIDDDDWNSVKPSANDMVIISGEVDKNTDTLEIDVDTISLKQ